MCRKRECPERIIYPFPQIDVIDLTMDELADDENGTVDNILRNDQWIHHPYNFLPSSDEEEQEVRTSTFKLVTPIAGISQRSKV